MPHMLVLRFLDRHSIPFFGAPKTQSLIGFKGVLKIKNMFFDFG